MLPTLNVYAHIFSLKQLNSNFLHIENEKYINNKLMGCTKWYRKSNAREKALHIILFATYANAYTPKSTSKSPTIIIPNNK